MSVCITKKNIFTIHLQVVSHAVLCCERRAKQNYSAYTSWPISIIAATVFSIIAQFCVATIMFYNTLATIMFFNLSPRRRRNPLPVQFVTCPATLAGHPPNKCPSTLCTNNREIEHKLYLRIWPVKDRNATTMAPVEGCLLNVTRNRAQRLRHLCSLHFKLH